MSAEQNCIQFLVSINLRKLPFVFGYMTLVEFIFTEAINYCGKINIGWRII